MTERVLCDDGLKVTLDGGGERTLLSVKGDATIRFWADTASVEAVLRGGVIQLSAYGGFCNIDVEGAKATVEFALEGAGRKRCTFPASELADALAWVRSLPSHSPPPDAIVVSE